MGTRINFCILMFFLVAGTLFTCSNKDSSEFARNYPVFYDGRYGVADQKGKVIKPLTYDFITLAATGDTFVGYKNDSIFVSKLNDKTYELIESLALEEFTKKISNDILSQKEQCLCANEENISHQIKEPLI